MTSTQRTLPEDSCNVLMVVPKFMPNSFWSYERTCEVLGARYPAPPLGMITLAALLPASWTIRLVNRNTEELAAADIAWADMVMTGGMLVQQKDTLRVIQLAQDSGKSVIVGGPDVTSSPYLYEAADIRVLGEAEGIIDEFVTAWRRGERQGVFESPKFQADVTKSPIPRFDLLKLSDYLYIGVQFSRGCPFTCEFCDIIELYGRAPRTKTPAQMLAELDALYELGYRGHVDFVDDNLIGNKKAVKEFLPHLIAWQKKRRYPFNLSTEASINLADDSQLLQLMREAGFFAVFVGIESPDEETLIETKKKQNTRRSIPESIQRIYEAGMLVAGGFILGFDSEKADITRALMRCVGDAMIPVANISLLYALAGTQLTRRLEREGRLHSDHETGNGGDFVRAGLNFDTVRPRRDILSDYVSVVSSLYDADAYFRRARGMALALNRIDLGLRIGIRDTWRDKKRFFRIMWHLTLYRPEMRRNVWPLFMTCLIKNPRAAPCAVMMASMYLSLGLLARFLVAQVQAEIDRIDAAAAPIETPLPAPIPTASASAA